MTAALAALPGLAGGAAAQTPPAPASAPPTITLIAPKVATPLKVTSGGWADGADIPFEFTQYRGNHFPGFSWTPGPEGTKAYALIMQDTDGVMRTTGGPILHWVVFNLPADTTKLEAAMTDLPRGAGYGPNYKGVGRPYLGPRTPPGPKHHYHVQVFALDQPAPDTAAISLQALTDAMQGHVLASGEVVGLGQADPTAPPPKPPPAAH